MVECLRICSKLSSIIFLFVLDEKNVEISVFFSKYKSYIHTTLYWYGGEEISRMDSFTCSPHNYCFNDGKCITNSSSSFCICNPGFGPDEAFFHDPSCTLPNNFYLGQLIEITLVSLVPLIGLFHIARRGTGKLKRAAFWMFIADFCIIFYALSVFLQNGAFEAAAPFSRFSF